MLHTKYESSALSISEEKNFKVVLLCSYVSNLWPPQGGAVLTPGASYEQSWQRSTRRYYIQNIKALHFLVSEKKNFKVFLLCSYVSNLWPSERDQFWPQGHHMNNLGRGLLGDATYPISKLYAIYFQRRRFSKILLFFSFWLPWQPQLWLEFNLLNNVGRASPKEHPCQVSSRLSQWFRRRRRLKKLWTRDAGHWAITKAHHEHFVLRWAKKHGGKRRKYWFPAFSPFPTMLSKGRFLRGIKSRNWVVKSLTTSTKKPFENNVGKGENTGNQHFSFFHNVFYPSQNEFHIFSHVYFVVCTCFQFGPV